jgi:hypothetical protein
MEYDNNHFIIASRAYSLHVAHLRLIEPWYEIKLLSIILKFNFFSIAFVQLENTITCMSFSSLCIPWEHSLYILVYSLGWTQPATNKISEIVKIMKTA